MNFNHIFDARIICRIALALLLMDSTVAQSPLDDGSNSTAFSQPKSIKQLSSSGTADDESGNDQEAMKLELTKLVAQARQVIAAGDLQQEIDIVERVAEMERKVFGPRHTEVAGSLKHLASCYAELRQFDKARVAAREAQSIYAEAHGDQYYRSIDCRLLQTHIDRLEVFDEDQWKTWQGLPQLEAKAESLAEQGDLKNAIRQQEEYLRALRNLLGMEHPKMVDGLRNLAFRYMDDNQFDAAIKLLDTARGISAQIQGDSHPEYAMVLIYLGMVYEANTKFPEAAEKYKTATTILTAVHRPSHPDRLVALESLARVQFQSKDYVSAANNWEPLVALIGDRDGAGSPEHLFLLKMLARSQTLAGQTSKANKTWQQRLELLQRQLPSDAQDVVETRDELANLAVTRREFDQALDLSHKNLAIAREQTPPDRMRIASAADQIVYVLVEMGRYVDAEPLAREAAELSLAAWDETKDVEARKLFANALGNLAAVKHKRGDFAESRALFEQALKVSRDVYGERSSVVATQLNNLAQLVYDQRDSQQFLKLQRQACEIFAELYPPDHPDYLKSQDNLALALREVGQHEAAERLFREVWETDKRVLGTEHPQTISVMLNLAVQLRYLDRHDEARQFYEQAVELYGKTVGDDHPLIANALLSQAQLEARDGNPQKAVELLTQVIRIRSEVFGHEHPETSMAQIELGKVLQAQGKIDEARAIYEQAFEARLQFAQTLLPTLAEAEALKFVAETKKAFSPLLSLYREQETQKAYAAVWNAQSLTTQAETARRAFAQQPEQLALMKELTFTRTELARLANNSPSSNNDAVRRQLTQLSERKEQLERELGRQFAGRYKIAVPDVGQLAAVLPQRAAVVHFVRRQRIKQLENKSELETLDIYDAFVIGLDNEDGFYLAWIELGDAWLIDAAVEMWRREIRRGGGTVRGVRRVRPPADTPPNDVDAGLFLRVKVWEPLESLLKDCDQVLIVPDGSLCGVPWGALPVAQPGRYLIEEYSLSTLSQPWQLPLLLNAPVPPLESCLLVGGIDYNAGRRPANNAQAVASSVRSGSSNWEYLPGTLTEIEGILGLAAEHASTKKLIGLEANEQTLRSRMPNAQLVHLATHGFFTPADEEEKPQMNARSSDDRMISRRSSILNRNPLLLSGLVLAGANAARSPDATGLTNMGDGVLTAEEIAAMELGDTHMVILSACETGLGKVAGGEGVYGLQRALQLAGVRSVVASLWKVDDAATESLMIEFYRNLWIKKLGKQESLRQAQIAMLRGKLFQPADNENAELPPRYWAAFVLSGDWR